MTYRVCVTGGYPINRSKSQYEAEAIVTVPGGIVVKRFIVGGSGGGGWAGPGQPRRKRESAERQAREWIAAQQ